MVDTDTVQIVERLARIETKVESFPRLEEKMDRLIGQFGETGNTIAAHEVRLNAIEAKLEQHSARQLGMAIAAFGGIATAVAEFFILHR